jgi:hypothetical protein
VQIARNSEEVVMRTLTKHAAVSLAGTASLIAGLALWPSVAAADSDQGGPPHRTVLEGSFVSEREEEAFVDNDGNRVPSLGDVLAYTNSSTGTLGAATDYGSCVFHRVDLTASSATLNCTVTTETAHGSLTHQGTARVGIASPVLLQPATWTITGGTGEFSGAEGEVHLARFEGAGLDFRTFGTIRVVMGR